MPTPTRRANPADTVDIALYRDVYARDGKRVVRPEANRAAAHAALSRLVKRYLPLALSIRDLHTPPLDDHTVESVLWDALGGAKSFTYNPDRASLAAWLRTTVRNALIDEARLLTSRAHDELDEAMPTATDDGDDLFLDLVRAIDAMLVGEARAELTREVIEARVLDPARRNVPPTKLTDLAREHDLSISQARTIVDHAEKVVRDAAAEIGLSPRISG